MAPCLSISVSYICLVDCNLKGCDPPAHAGIKLVEGVAETLAIKFVWEQLLKLLRALGTLYVLDGNVVKLKLVLEAIFRFICAFGSFLALFPGLFALNARLFIVLPA